MGRFLLSIWRDIKANKLFTAIIFIEILALILVSAYVLQNTDVNNELLNKYDSEYNESIIVTDSKIKDYLGKEGFQNYAISDSESTSDGKLISVINKRASEILKVNHSGSWFGEAGAVNGIEALVSKSLRRKYEKGKTYNVEYSDGSSVNIFVIGYLAKENTVISINGGFYENLFGYADIMLCDEINPETFTGRSAILLDGKKPQFYLDNYSLSALTLKSAYDEFYSFIYMSLYHGAYWVAIIIVLIIGAIMCNSLFMTEKAIRANASKFIVGQSRKNIIAGELTKSGLLYLIPFLIDLIIVAVIEALNKGVYPPIIGYKSFFLSALMVLGIYLLTIAISTTRILTAKPLKELRKKG